MRYDMTLKMPLAGHRGWGTPVTGGQGSKPPFVGSAYRITEGTIDEK